MSTPFSHGPSRVIAELLWRNRGIGTDPAWWRNHEVTQRPADGSRDWPVRYENEGDRPDETITVYETTPVFQAKILLTGEVVQNLGITVRVRSKDPEVARRVAEQIRVDFNERANYQTITLDTDLPTEARYLVQSFPKTSLVPARRIAPGSDLWSVNLNCLVVILPYPIAG